MAKSRKPGTVRVLRRKAEAPAKQQVQPISVTASATPATLDPSQVTCSHFGCDAQPGEPCIDENFAGGVVNKIPFAIDGKPAFHAERLLTAGTIGSAAGGPGDRPTEAQLGNAIDASGLV